MNRDLFEVKRSMYERRHAAGLVEESTDRKEEGTTETADAPNTGEPRAGRFFATTRAYFNL